MPPTSGTNHSHGHYREKTPIEAWTNKHPNIAHLQEFRIPVWIL